MDPDLMTAKEIERRGRVFIDPCLVCAHNRQAHVIQGLFTFEVHEQRMERDIEDACIACGCLEFISQPDDPHSLGDGCDPNNLDHLAFVDRQHTEILERTEHLVKADDGKSE